MNRDNLLFAVVGILFGFISGYFVHEVMVERQPPRFPPAAGAAAPGSAAVAGPPPSGAGPAAGAAMPEIQRLVQWVAEHPDDADAVLALANANYDIRNWVRARELYEHHATLRQPSPDTLTDYGVSLRQLGEPAAALAQFDRAQELDPSHWASRFNEVVVRAFDLGDFAAARGVLAELEALQPGNADVARLAAEVDRIARERGAQSASGAG